LVALAKPKAILSHQQDAFCISHDDSWTIERREYCMCIVISPVHLELCTKFWNEHSNLLLYGMRFNINKSSFCSWFVFDDKDLGLYNRSVILFYCSHTSVTQSYFSDSEIIFKNRRVPFTLIGWYF
jgi:hypothetical protein